MLEKRVSTRRIHIRLCADLKRFGTHKHAHTHTDTGTPTPTASTTTASTASHFLPADQSPKWYCCLFYMLIRLARCLFLFYVIHSPHSAATYTQTHTRAHSERDSRAHRQRQQRQMKIIVFLELQLSGVFFFVFFAFLFHFFFSILQHSFATCLLRRRFSSDCTTRTE